MAFQPSDSFNEKKEILRQQRRQRKSGWGGGVGLAIFAVIWTALVLCFDVFVGYGMVKAVLAQNYPSTTGEVIHSKLERHRGDDGYTYGADIHFTYAVGGQTYTSEEHSYGAWNNSDSSGARKLLRKYPVGETVTVYYNPSDPSDAVLERGVQGMHAFMLMFMAPFNVVMLGLWYGAVVMVWTKLFGNDKDKIGGYELVQEGFQTRLKLGNANPLVMVMVGFGVGCFLSIFPIAFLGYTESLTAVGIGLAFAAACAVFGGYWQIKRNITGEGDLILDRTNMKLVFPAVAMGGTPMELSMMDLNTVGVKRVSDSNSNDQFAPTVTYIDENQIRQEIQIVKWQDEDAANDLADWLRQELGLEQPG